MTRILPRPFSFSAHQRETLLTVWKNPKHHDQANIYLNAIVPRISIWMAFKENPGPTHGEIRASVSKLKNALEGLQSCLTDDPNAALVVIDGTQIVEVRTSNATEKTLDQLRATIDALASGAREVEARIRVHRGPDVSLETWLVAMLAKLWELAFEEAPKERGRFGEFLRRLSSEVLGYDIGPKAIVDGLQSRNSTFVPPA
jgi:hypothetical protein